MERVYMCIDLKSFYASAECAALGLDPLTTNLVVADVSRTEKTICLAVSPSLKKYGIPGRARLFEVIQAVDKINNERKKYAPGHILKGESSDAIELKRNKSLALGYIAATPRMAMYIKVSSEIYSVYLKYFAPEDIHVYSIDEVFIDVTSYLSMYKISPEELARRIVKDVFLKTNITATAGIGTNMYLAKVAMDIVAKHCEADEYGTRVAYLDEMSYREKLWNHRPITDFWRVGHGIARKLEDYGIYTMGDIAKVSVGAPDDIYNEEMLFKLFGVNAELLIDHAWGYEPALMTDIKSYKPKSNSMSVGQVIHCAQNYDDGRLIVTEMMDQFSLDLVEKNLVVDSIGLAIGYDISNINDEYSGALEKDYMGRILPKGVHGGLNLGMYTSSTRILVKAINELYTKLVNPKLLIRRVNIGAHIIPAGSIPKSEGYEQLDLFTDYDEKRKKEEAFEKALDKEHRAQEAIVKLKKKYGKNSVLKGMNLEEASTMIDRNNQIGGHKA